MSYSVVAFDFESVKTGKANDTISSLQLINFKNHARQATKGTFLWKVIYKKNFEITTVLRDVFLLFFQRFKNPKSRKNLKGTLDLKSQISERGMGSATHECQVVFDSVMDM